MTVLKAINLGKSYRQYNRELHRIVSWFGWPVTPAKEAWVARHINFSIRSGEALGIIGQNGAGKSTLLKMITGTLRPSEGELHINGRISAILELGMGFNPELTGRQNVRHAAGLMGFSLQQIESAMSYIENFAEIGDYFDAPVRTYSSGMQVRVAFAVATAWRPEILIIDEALSVGDTYFQHKSFSRIREFREQGTTLIFVSHDRNAIQALCDRAILLEGGSIVKDGDPEAVFDFYNALVAEKDNSTIVVTELENGMTKTSSGTGEAEVVSINLFGSEGNAVEYIDVGENVELRILVKVNSPIDSLVLGYGIKDRLGQVMYGTNTWHTNQTIHDAKPGDEFQYIISFPANFGVGSYSIQTALTDRDTHLTANYEWQDLALVFNVINTKKIHFVGSLWNEPNISVESLKN